MSVDTAGTDTTGRYLIVLSDDLVNDDVAARAAVEAVSGVTDVRSTADAPDNALRAESISGSGAVLFSELGVAVVTVPAGRVGTEGLTTAGFARGDERVLAVEPERVLHALGSPAEPDVEQLFSDDDVATWGLHATGVLASTETGEGVTLAVLDTGLDLTHPDFAERDVEARSFVAGERAQDAQGHGTHCAGTAAGTATPEDGRRYSVAPGVRLLVGKVLSDAGSGTDADILAGMSWAISSGAQVISMSLGADQRTVSTAYETVGRRALAAGTLIVAAAGNNASRDRDDPGFVGVPANSPSIMAVGALDAGLGIADFSAAATDTAGGEVDIAGPGVDVYSSWPMPTRTRTISGTSMATPHVAGIAALWAQRTGATGRELWDAVTGAARSVPLPAADVGAGLVAAPEPTTR